MKILSSDVTGKDILKISSIYDDFLDIFGLALTDEYTISTFERNARLSGNTNEIQRILNSVPVCQPEEIALSFTICFLKLPPKAGQRKITHVSTGRSSGFYGKISVAGNRIIMKKKIFS
ncbi:MAG: hypothetical protein ACLTS6_01585 [Anaerobutyricum sp.]